MHLEAPFVFLFNYEYFICSSGGGYVSEGGVCREAAEGVFTLMLGSRGQGRLEAEVSLSAEKLWAWAGPPTLTAQAGA